MISRKLYNAKNSPFGPPFPPGFYPAIAITPKVTGLLSIVGSAFVIQDVLRSPQRRGRVYNRIVVGMSVHDLIWAVVCFLSSWPLPPSGYAYGARGTVQTCTAAGFFGVSAVVVSIWYSCVLTLFFLLVIRFGWREERLKWRNLERWMHAVPIVVGWGIGFAGLPLKLYNPTTWFCWIQEVPYGCRESYTLTDPGAESTTCLRGDNAGIYRWAFVYGFVWAAWVFNGVAMACIYWNIHQKERASERYSVRSSSRTPSSQRNSTGSRSNNDNFQDDGDATRSSLRNSGGGRGSLSNILSSFRYNKQRRESSSSDAQRAVTARKNSTKFAWQAAYYVICFFLVWIIPTVQGSIQSFAQQVYWPMMLVTTILMPLQGWFNFVIYIRPRIVRYRKEHGGSLNVRERVKVWVSGQWSTEQKSGGEKGVSSQGVPRRAEEAPNLSMGVESAVYGEDGNTDSCEKNDGALLLQDEYLE